MPADPFPWPPDDPDVRVALQEAFASGAWGKYHGPYGEQLEQSLARQFATQHAYLCCSGTIAVELALRGCGVEAGDEVILAGYDFPGNFRAIEAIGARPVLVDIDPTNWSLNANQLQEAAASEVKAVLVSHLHGGLADMPTIVEIAAARGWKIVEDACQQPGAVLEGRPVGAWGDAAVLSFGGSKLLTAGRGGAVLTNNLAVYQRAKLFGERGNQAFPLSELQAAVLLPQLARLNERNLARARNIEHIRKATEAASRLLRPIQADAPMDRAFYKHAWSYVPAENKADARQQLLARLWADGVPFDAGFRGFTRRSERRCRRPVDLLWSERYSQSTILLHHPILLCSPGAISQSQIGTTDQAAQSAEQDELSTSAHGNAALQAAKTLVQTVEQLGA